MRAVRNVVIFLVVVWIVVGVVQPAIDRANRTQLFPGVVSTGPVHLAPDGRMVVVDATSGQALAVEGSTGVAEVLVDGLQEPRAAHIGADGTACAIDQGQGGIDPPKLRCTGGRVIELVVDGAASSDGSPNLADVVSGRHGDWFVSDPGRHLVLQVSADDSVAVAARFAACSSGSPPITPTGLATSEDGTVFIAVADRGVTTLTDETDRGCETTTWVGGDGALAVIPTRSIPLVLVTQAGTGTGAIHWHPGGDAANWDLLAGITSPRGMALLPDRRIAVSANGSLFVYRPALLPGY